ncbi:MAG: HAD family hydrolase [Actinomycetales bacterium]
MLVCLDMAGTTVRDDGLVLDAFAAALAQVEHPLDEDTREVVVATMGQSKIEVFTSLLGSLTEAQRATEAFEQSYEHLVRQRGADLIPGTAHTLAWLREQGASICLTTGFSPATRDLLIESCGLRGLIDLALSPVDTAHGRGRPAPDMILTALMATGTSAVSRITVVGDTRSDMASGVAAGAGLIVGVLTGIHSEADLVDAGSTHVIESVADLPSVVVASRVEHAPFIQQPPATPQPGTGRR